MRQNLTKLIHERSEHIEDQILEEQALGEETLALLQTYLTNDLPLISEAIVQNSQIAKKDHSRLTEKMQTTFDSLHADLQQEKVKREKQEAQLMQKLQVVAQKVKSEIKKHRDDRLKTESTMVKLLEETCNKLT